MRQFDEYYGLHPELKEIDDYIRSLPGPGSSMHEADQAMFFSPAKLMYRLGAPDVVEGKPAEKTVKITPERAAEKIKNYAGWLGADLVNFSEMHPAYAYSRHGRIKYESEPWGKPVEISHKYAISLGFAMDPKRIYTGPRYSEMIETGSVYLKSAVISVVLADYIRSLGYPARAHHFRNYQVLPVPLAVEAGMGELARCGFLLTKEFGNCLRLATVTTDLPAACDRPIDIGVQDFCEMCRLCAEACPSGAIPKGGKTPVRGVDKWQLDAVKCISFWNKIGTDCGMCIGSCPWTQPDSWYHNLGSSLAAKSHWARVLLLWVYPVLFGKYRAEGTPGWLGEV